MLNILARIQEWFGTITDSCNGHRWTEPIQVMVCESCGEVKQVYERLL